MHIKVSNVSKSYVDRVVLEKVSCAVSSGEIVGLVGANGSGKSTLLQIIMGEESPDSGAISVSPSNARIGYLPQQDDADSSRQELSSGEKLRARFAEILSEEPDMLILDEPTNHLDWEALEWLEQQVLRFDGPVLIVSHDRAFLDETVDQIIELADGACTVYGGNYSFYKDQKQTQEAANLRNYTEQKKRHDTLKERARVMKTQTQQLEVRTTGADHYVRRKAAKAARAAIHMERRIAKELAETAVVKPEPEWQLKALFTPLQESSRTVAQVQSISYKDVLSDVSFHLERGSKQALVGRNGSGKTTLIRILLGELEPDAGTVRTGDRVDIGYLGQEHETLDMSQTIYESLHSPRVDETECFKLLRRFMIPPEKMHQKVSTLSSGERTKLSLAQIMSKGANFIILDEPTNHLDIPSREALEQSLHEYTGTLLVVSHDRYFLKNAGITEYLLLEDGQLKAI